MGSTQVFFVKSLESDDVISCQGSRDCLRLSGGLDMFLDATEVDIELVEGCEEGAEGCAFSHLGEGIDVLGEALAAVAELAIGTGDIGVGVVDIP